MDKELDPAILQRKQQEVAEHGPAGGRRDDEVDDGEGERRDEQTYRIVNPQPAERGAARAGRRFPLDMG